MRRLRVLTRRAETFRTPDKCQLLLCRKTTTNEGACSSVDSSICGSFGGGFAGATRMYLSKLPEGETFPTSIQDRARLRESFRDDGNTPREHSSRQATPPPPRETGPGHDTRLFLEE